MLSQQHITAVCAINLNSRIDECQVCFPKLEHATNIINNLLKVERVRSRSFARC